MMLTCCALVLFLTPGLAFFYGGLVGRKNILRRFDAMLPLHGCRKRSLGWGRGGL